MTSPTQEPRRKGLFTWANSIRKDPSRPGRGGGCCGTEHHREAHFTGDYRALHIVSRETRPQVDTTGTTAPLDRPFHVKQLRTGDRAVATETLHGRSIRL